MDSRRADPLFEPGAVVSALRRRCVRVVVVGALAAELRGIGGIVTRDLDLTPDLNSDNLQRLAEVLHELEATVRIQIHTPGPVRLPPDGRLLARAPILNLHLPRHGDVDIIHQAAAATAERGPLDYAHLVKSATRQRFPRAGHSVLVMSEADWLEAKRTPPVREKDARHIALYQRWLRERP